jgi:hypothetical protein
VFEPGAGGEHKVARGFEPTLTFSNHYLRHSGLKAAIQSYLDDERPAVLQHVAEYPSVFKETD